MASDMACHHRPWTLYIVGRHRAWHDIIILGLNTQSKDVGHDNAIIAFGQHTCLDDVGC